MKIYEVFVNVPYCDADYNECYNRHNGTFFANRNDAEAYIIKMFADENANRNLEPSLPFGDEPEHRCVTLYDYVETNITWDTVNGWAYSQTKSESEIDYFIQILERNDLVDDMKLHDAILLAVTYGGNRWYLREVELN